MNIIAVAAEDLNNLNLDIGDVIVDVEQVTEENGVNPYALKVALEEGLNAEEASPFSSLATRIPNIQYPSFRFGRIFFNKVNNIYKGKQDRSGWNSLCG